MKNDAQAQFFKAGLGEWVFARFHDLVFRLALASPLRDDAGAPLSEEAFLDVLRRARAMPEATNEEREVKREALLGILPFEAEAYAAGAQADDIRTLLERVMPEESLGADTPLGLIRSDMTALVESLVFCRGGSWAWWMIGPDHR